MFPYYRSPKTTQEIRENCDPDYKDFVRAKRKNIPTTYDDLQISSIKDKKRYKKNKRNGRGKRREYLVTKNDYECCWKFEEYCKQHNIPYRIEKIKRASKYNRAMFRWVYGPKKPEYLRKYDKQLGKFVLDTSHQIGWKDTGRWEKVGEKEVTGSKTVGYRLIWWCDKDIGIEYVLLR